MEHSFCKHCRIAFGHLFGLEYSGDYVLDSFCAICGGTNLKCIQREVCLMSLSGSLKDFDISYIVQIIAQESKTGRLVLSSEDSEAFVIFKSGRIVSAGTNRKNIQTMIFNYLTKIRNIRADVVTELRAMFQNDIRRFVEELCAKRHVTQDEILYIIRTSVEDITCALFSIKDGSYKFNLMPSADMFEIGDFSIATDMIMMEAARRTDEMAKAGNTFTRSTVFIHTAAPDYSQTMAINPLTQFKEYLFHQIDGATPVEQLCDGSFLSDYQVKLALMELVEEKRIANLPEGISNSINAAIRKSSDSGMSILVKSFISTGITIFFALTMYLVGMIVLPAALRDTVRQDWRGSHVEAKIDASELLFQARFGRPATSRAQIVSAGMLSKAEIEAEKSADK